MGQGTDDDGDDLVLEQPLVDRPRHPLLGAQGESVLVGPADAELAPQVLRGLDHAAGHRIPVTTGRDPSSRERVVQLQTWALDAPAALVRVERGPAHHLDSARDDHVRLRPQLGWRLRAGHGHAYPDLEPAQSSERIQVGRVVAGVERPPEAVLLEQVPDGRALVGFDRRPQLEHLASESRYQSRGARAGGDPLEDPHEEAHLRAFEDAFVEDVPGGLEVFIRGRVVPVRVLDPRHPARDGEGDSLNADYDTVHFTGDLAFDVSADALREALEALEDDEGNPVILPGDVEVERFGPVYRVKFTKNLGSQPIELLAFNDRKLTSEGPIDVLTVDDSANPNDTTLLLTSWSITGLGMPSVNEIQTLRLNATEGTFRLSFTDAQVATLREGPGNHLPSMVFLPTYTATAHFHKKLPSDLQANLTRALAESQLILLSRAMLGEIEVAEKPDQAGEDAAPLVAEDLLELAYQ